MFCLSDRMFIKILRKLVKCAKCGVKTSIVLFWGTLYMVVMKMTLFKSTETVPAKQWDILPDNYTRWLFQGPVLGEDDDEYDFETDGNERNGDNATMIDLNRRAEWVQLVCFGQKLPSENINSKEFFVDRDHSLVWCNIFKAASSSWLYNINVLGGYSKSFLARSRQNPLILARRKFPRPSEEEVRDAVTTPGVISFLIVREPFARLLSAYRDKLENHTPPFYRKLAKTIIEKYRNKSNAKPKKNYGPTFYEFVSYLIDSYKNDKNFRFDEHWAPFHQFCTPCAVNFTVVAKVETLARDSRYIINQLGLGHVLGRRRGDRRTRFRTIMNKSRDGKKTIALLKHYFSQLDQKMLSDLLEIYNIDFHMFGYSPDVYKEYVKK